MTNIKLQSQLNEANQRITRQSNVIQALRKRVDASNASVDCLRTTVNDMDKDTDKLIRRLRIIVQCLFRGEENSILGLVIESRRMLCEILDIPRNEDGTPK